ncbi:MAG: hypothetical protein KDD42_06480 [Bdellovibrionales bacterium]|nr:hypothetical protein [Bdellovibrionales bacterium]
MIFNRVTVIAGLLALQLFGASSSWSTPRHPYRAELRYAHKRLIDLTFQKKLTHSSNKQRFARIPRIRISGYIPGEGRFLGYLNQQLSADWKRTLETSHGLIEEDSPLILLRGIRKNNRNAGKTEPIAAALFRHNDAFQLRLDFKSSNSSRHQRSFVLRDALKEEKQPAKVRSAPSSLGRGRECSSKAAGRSSSLMRTQPGPDDDRRYHLLGNRYIAEIAIETDYQWYQEYGESSNSEAASLLNALQTIYQRDLNLEFVIVRQNTITTNGNNYKSTDPEALLDSFTSRSESLRHLGEADLYHLITGRELNGNTIGIAYQLLGGGGVVCNSPELSYGLTQKFHPAIDYLTLGHEIGHNFGANHDDIDLPNIMQSVITSSGTQFASTAQTEVGNHIVQYAEFCLDPSEAIAPTPTPSPNLPNLPEVSFQVELDSLGNVGMTSSLIGGELDQACSTSLLVSKNSSFKNPSSVVLSGGNQPLVEINVSIPLKIKKPRKSMSKKKKREATSLYLRARYACTDQTNYSYSDPRKLNLLKIKDASISNDRANKSSWTSQFLSALEEAVVN